MNIIDVMRNPHRKTMVDVNDEVTVHNNGLMIKNQQLVVNYLFTYKTEILCLDSNKFLSKSLQPYIAKPL